MLDSTSSSSSPRFEYGVPRRSVSFGEQDIGGGQRGPEYVRTPGHRSPAISRGVKEEGVIASATMVATACGAWRLSIYNMDGIQLKDLSARRVLRSPGRT